LSEARPGWEPPVGTQQRIRTRAVWAVALFTASVLPALVGLGIAPVTPDKDNVALPLATLFWAVGLFFALWAAYPTVRYWEALPNHIRWMGALPWLTVSSFACAVLITVLIA
jgi:hypothetical protein